MAKFFGAVGYGEMTETVPGVSKEVITEHQYYGDVVKNTRKQLEGDNLNPDISVGNSIEIVADAYANEHIFAMRYVLWSGVRWSIQEVEVLRPRLLLRLGGVWNGAIPVGPPAPA